MLPAGFGILCVDKQAVCWLSPYSVLGGAAISPPTINPQVLNPPSYPTICLVGAYPASLDDVETEQLLSLLLLLLLLPRLSSC
jgi:hypothetical protein